MRAVWSVEGDGSRRSSPLGGAMAANDPIHATPDGGNVYDATRQAMHEVSTDARFDIVDARFEAVDAKFEAVDARFDAIDRRLDAIVTKIDELSRQIDKRFAQVDKHFEDLEGRFFRLQLTLIAGGFAVIATLIAT